MKCVKIILISVKGKVKIVKIILLRQKISIKRCYRVILNDCDFFSKVGNIFHKLFWQT
jgi:hypothetical protein